MNPSSIPRVSTPTTISHYATVYQAAIAEIVDQQRLQAAGQHVNAARNAYKHRAIGREPLEVATQAAFDAMCQNFSDEIATAAVLNELESN